MNSKRHSFEEILPDCRRAAVVGELLSRAGLTLATAESCTGGLIGAMITSVPGASRYYRGSIVAYHNDVKAQLLGVPQSVLTSYGAVSPQTVLSMARGVQRLLQANCAIAASGIAGPGGATTDKKRGLVCLAVCVCRRHETLVCRFRGNRHEVRLQATQKALIVLQKMLREYLPRGRRK